MYLIIFRIVFNKTIYNKKVYLKIAKIKKTLNDSSEKKNQMSKYNYFKLLVVTPAKTNVKPLGCLQ